MIDFEISWSRGLRTEFELAERGRGDAGPLVPDSRLRVLQISSSDIGGGAARIAWNLFRFYRQQGHESWLAVDKKHSSDPDVLEMPRPAGTQMLRDRPRRWRTKLERKLGIEDFNFPATDALPSLPEKFPHLLHAHNMHGGYFDLRVLPRFSRQMPFVLTLHDSWLLTGHCAHSFGCERWRTGCGRCPDLTIYPAIRRDATAYNWRRKGKIYARSRLYVATPCAWLMRRVESSNLAPGVCEARVFPNGVDLAMFHPAIDRAEIRDGLGLDPMERVILFASNGVRNSIFRDYATFRAAVGIVAAAWNGNPLVFICLGDEGSSEKIGNARLQFVPFTRNLAAVPRYFQAADLYVHAARVDTFPNTVIEALACGTPVVASAVGGIPEQIDEGITGFLVEPRNPQLLADRITLLVDDDSLRLAMGRAARDAAIRRFNLDDQATNYLEWYSSILGSRPRDAQSSH